LHKIRAWWCVEEAEVRYHDFYRVGADLLMQLNVGLATRYCQDVKLPPSTPWGKIKGMEVYFHSLYGSEWSTYAGADCSRKSTSVSNEIGPGTGLEVLEKSPYPPPNFEPRTIQAVAQSLYRPRHPGWLFSWVLHNFAYVVYLFLS
jgi:hypothetical protein